MSVIVITGSQSSITLVNKSDLCDLGVRHQKYKPTGGFRTEKCIEVIYCS